MSIVHSVTGPNHFEAFDDTPGIFDNHIALKSLRGECVLPIDCQLGVQFKSKVEAWAANETQFFHDFVAAYGKMMGLTAAPLDPTLYKLSIPTHSNLRAENGYRWQKYSFHKQSCNRRLHIDY